MIIILLHSLYSDFEVFFFNQNCLQVQEEVSTLRREVNQKSEESRQRQSLLEKQIVELETLARSKTQRTGNVFENY